MSRASQLLERDFTFIAHQVKPNGSLANKENLNNDDEVNTWMAKFWGKYATIKITRSDGRWIIYTDDGTSKYWVVSEKGKK